MPSALHGRTWPLLAERDLAAPLAWCEGRAVSAGAFLAAAAQLAEHLPAPGRPINLCQDRLHFALGLAAALLRGQTSLMPPNALPATLRQLPTGGAAPYVLLDAPTEGQATPDVGGLPVVRVAFAHEPHAPEAPDAPDAPDASQAAASRPDGRGANTVPAIAGSLEAVCLLTSGSTGAPQPHGKPFAALTANIAAEAQRLAEWLGRPTLHGLTVVATVPAQHSYGLESSVLLALLGGASFDSGRPFYPADIAAALARVPRPRALVTTPFHLKALLLAGVPLPPVDLVLSATAPLSPQLAAQAEAAMGACLGEIYGCTEAGQVAARRTTQGETWTTLGELRITSEPVPPPLPAEAGNRGAPSAAPAEGERFVVFGGHVEVPTPLADVLVLQDERHFRLLGRANDLIHVAGKRSSLAHLNFHLNRIEGVDDGAFWLPEPGDALPLGPAGGGAQPALEAVQRPIAFVVAPRLTAAQIIAALRAELEPAFVPRRVVQVAALPREATGKLTVSALRTWALATLAATGSPRPSDTLATRAPATPARFGNAAVAADPHPVPDTIRSADARTTLVALEADIYPIAANHPSFTGHFPGHPLLPGVVLLSLVQRSLARRPAMQARLGAEPVLEQVKFLAPVGPGEQVQVRLRPQGAGVAFECRVGSHAGERIAARGQFGPRRSTPPEGP